MEHKQFDFWIGDWDVFESERTTRSAHIRVERILDNCVLWERYEDPTGLRGESFSIYDSGRKRWQQTWVTNRGQLLTMSGQLQGGEMVLLGDGLTSEGQQSRVRGTWKAVGDGVRETAVVSSDNGKTWKPWFDLHFRSRTATANEDEEAVVVLDQQFQAAVKANDFVTMDKILANDFMLVTGSGKVFNKSDLIQEARDRSSMYQHQEDTERTVRVWGDTAVVTAKLWIKAMRDGKPIEYKLWFSDTYVRTRDGWRYVFGQASLPLQHAS
jgi:ketosteroid isomerase-like protein